MSRTFLFALAFALALVPAAGAGKRPEALGLTAAPARIVFHGGGAARVRLRNPGRKAIAVEAASAGLALDLHGRPRIVKRRGPRSAAGWLTLRPGHIKLAPHAAAALRVSARVPPRAEPGDHDALVLLSGRPLGQARVSVRLRLGVVVVVRAPGAVVRRLKLRPHTRGLLEFRLHAGANGPITARVVVPAEPGRPRIRRTYRIRI